MRQFLYDLTNDISVCESGTVIIVKVFADPELFEAVISEHRKNIPAYDCPLPEGIIPKVVR